MEGEVIGVANSVCSGWWECGNLRGWNWKVLWSFCFISSFLLCRTWTLTYYVLHVFAGGRGLDVAGLPVKKHSFDSASACEPESPMTRKPFLPISTTIPTKNSSSNVPDDSTNPKSNELLQKTLPGSNIFFSTPTKNMSGIGEENRTPKTMPVPIPSTPPTISVPMQTAITPAPVSVPALVVKAIIPEEIEYSFEERRAGFLLPVISVWNLRILLKCCCMLMLTWFYWFLVFWGTIIWCSSQLQLAPQLPTIFVHCLSNGT